MKFQQTPFAENHLFMETKKNSSHFYAWFDNPTTLETMLKNWGFKHLPWSIGN